MCAELDGEGFSMREMQIALQVISNQIFKAQWKIPEEKDYIPKYNENDCEDIKNTFIDSNALLTCSAIHKKLKQMHVYSLDLIANKIMLKIMEM